MVEDEKLAIDESRRVAQHEAIKGTVREEVHSEIARKADRLDPVERAEADQVAEELKHKAVHEVRETETEIDRARGVARVSQVIDYIFYLIYGIIGLEIILELIGARESNGFKNFIDTIASPLLAPFRGLVADPARGAMQLRLSYIVALAVYLLLHLAINGLLRMIAHRKTTV
ncbi:MAG TPA: YggT family protein [Blastocatellia bacterium]|nr:YggT family protein [Blastocatellia bacterium]